MARKDVELVIRAKDEAAKAVNAVTAAINALTGAQDDLVKSAGKSDNALGALGGAFSDLTKKLSGLSVAGKISAELDKATEAVARLEAGFRETAAESERLNKAAAESAANLQKLRTEANASAKATSQQAAAFDKAKADLAALNLQVRESTASREKLIRSDARLTAEIIKQEGRMTALAARYKALAAEIAKTTEPTATLKARFEAVNAAGEKNAKKLEEMKASQAGIRTEIEKTGTGLASMAARLEQSNAALAKAKAALDATKTGYAELKVAVKSASAAQKDLDQAAEATADALIREQAALDRAKNDLNLLAAAAGKADAAMTELAAGSTAALQRSFDLQRRAMLEVRREWQKAEAAAKTLAASMTAIGPPTRAQAAAWGLAVTAAQKAKAEYNAQKTGLQQLSTILRQTAGSVDELRARQEAFVATQARVGTSIASIRAQAAQSVAAYQRLAAEAGKAAGAARQFSASAGRGSAAGAIEKEADDYRRLYGETRLAMSWTQRLRGEVLALVSSFAGIYGIIGALGQVVDAFRTMEAATSRLNVVFSGNTAAVGTELDFIRRNADRLGISFGELVDEYTKFAVATKGTNLEGANTRKIFISVAEAGRVNKLSLEQMKGVFNALTQIVSKGTVQMEELKQQLGDRLPGAIQIMADALGVTTAELIKMTAAGEVSSDALIKFAEELDKRFGSQLAAALQTTTAEMGRFQNSVFQALVAFGKGGFIASFTNLLKQLNETMRSAQFESFMAKLSSAAGTVVDVLAVLVKHFDLVVIAATAFAALKIAPFLIATVKRLNELRAALVLSGAAFSTTVGGLSTAGASAGVAASAFGRLALAVRGLLASFGWVGLIVTVATGFATWKTRADDVTAAMNAHRKIVDEVRNAYDEAEGSVKKWADGIKNVTKLQAEANVKATAAAAAAVRAASAFNPTGLSLAHLEGGAREQAKFLRDVREEFVRSGGDLDAYKAKLEAIGEVTTDETVRELALALQDQADSFRDTDTAAKEAVAAYDAVAGTATKATEKILGLGDTTEDTAKKMAGPGADAIERWEAALAKVGELIPEINDGLKEMAELAELDAAFEPMIRAARTMSELNGLIDQYNRARATISQAGTNEFVGGGNLVDRIIGAESGGNASATNPMSSATGLGQFIESTWLRLFKEHFPDRAASLSKTMQLELRKNATISRQMVEIYAKENAAVLQRAGVAVNDAAVYLAHFLGPGGAIAVLKAQGSTAIEDVLAPGQIAANRSVLEGKTAREVFEWAQRKVGLSQEELAIQNELGKLEEKKAEDATTATEKAREYNSALEERLAQQAVENANEGRLTQEAFVQKALFEEQKRAKEAGVTLTAQQIEQIKQLAAAEFQRVDAARENKTEIQEANAALALANALSQQQATLEREIAEARKSGDSSRVEELGVKLAEVNAQLSEAIAKATAMWQAIDSPQAPAALAKLETLKIKSAEVAQSTFLDWNRVANMFASGLTNAIDKFIGALAEGKSVGEAASEAFLQFAADFLRQIAQMIIQQAILNALRSFFPGLGGAGVGLGHSGGLVGSKRIGSGNMTRRVDPGIFAAAGRMHGGGVVGLRPGEVPAILKKNEEVLTENNPRHMFNSGAGAAPVAPGDTKIVNAFDTASFLEEALRSRPGERAILNLVRANSRAFREALNG